MNRIIVPFIYRLGGPIGTYWACGQLGCLILGFFAKAFSEVWFRKRLNRP